MREAEGRGLKMTRCATVALLRQWECPSAVKLQLGFPLVAVRPRKRNMARFTKVSIPLLLIMSVSPALADEGASGLYVPGNFGFGAGVTPDPGLYLSSGVVYYDGAIKVYIEGGKIVLNVDKRPFSTAFAVLWVPETKILGGQIGLSLGSSYNFAWAHGEVTGLINAEKTVEGWGLGDTIAACADRLDIGGLVKHVLPDGLASNRPLRTRV